MGDPKQQVDDLRRENSELQRALDNATDVARALAAAEVDAIACESGATPVLLRAAQEKLRERETILRAIFDGALDALLLADDEGRYVDANPAACELFGRTKHEIVGRRFSELTSSDRRGTNAWQKSCEEGRMRGETPLFLQKNGTKRLLEFRSAASIVPGLHLYVLRDVTEQRQAVEQLRASEERYRQIVETTSEGVWMVDGSLTTTFVNQRMADMLGCCREEIVGRPATDFVAEEGQTLVAEMAERRRRGLSDPFESSLRRRDGTTIWALVKSNAIFDSTGRVIGSIALLTDMTENRKFVEARNQLAAIVESSGDAIVSKTLDGTVKTWNAAAERLFGYTADEIVGRPIALVIPDDGKDEELEVLARVANGDRVGPVDGVRRSKSGAHVPVSLVFSPIRDGRGEIAAVSTIARDLSEQKKQAEALRRSEERLRQAQKMEAIGSLAGGIAHDFNNILSVILGFTGVVMQDLGSEHPLHADLAEVHAAGERAAKLTRQLLAFSRQQVLQPKVVDLRRVIEGLEKMLRRILGEDIVLDVTFDRTLGAVYADAGQIEQVVLNLAVNSRDAMPSGGVFTIETNNVVVKEGPQSEHAGIPAGRYVVVSVGDDGVGMDAATRERIFEPFFTTKEPGKGTGLGLATVYGIVEQSGGHVTVESAVGRGTTFRVYLPRVDGIDAAGSTVPPHAIDSYRGSETILLVEDEEQVRCVARAVLRRLGYRVLEAQNGGEAFLVAERCETPIHLLLTDLVMPRMHGPDVARRLKLERSEMRVLYMSGYAKPAKVSEPVLRGERFLPKPFTPEALASAVRSALDGD